VSPAGGGGGGGGDAAVAHGLVLAITDDFWEWFPARSYAATAITYDVPQSTPVSASEVAPVRSFRTPFTYSS
jgi:hypothetical protein